MRDTYRLLSVVLRQRMVAALPALAAAPRAVPELVSAAAGAPPYPLEGLLSAWDTPAE